MTEIQALLSAFCEGFGSWMPALRWKNAGVLGGKSQPLAVSTHTKRRRHYTFRKPWEGAIATQRRIEPFMLTLISHLSSACFK